MDISRFRLLCVWGVADPYYCAVHHKKGSKAPDPNPGMIASAQASEKVGMEAVELGREQLAWAKEIGAEQLDLARKVIEQQLAIGDANEARAAEQWERWESLFGDVEERMVQDAMEFDSPERRERVAGEAAADVARAFDAMERNQELQAMDFGLDPSSRRTAGAERAAGLERARLMAGAMTDARRDTELQGMAMREGVAKFGRGLPSTGIAADSLALSSGSSAVGNMNQSAGAVGANMSGAGNWYARGLGAIGQAGQIYGQEYQGRLNAWQASMNAEATGWAGLGALAGTLGAAAILSSKEFKEDGAPISEEAALEGLKQIPVESWKYKDGVADGRGHIGPYAEDVQAQFGDGVAPDGRVIDLASMNGLMLAGLQALTKKVERLEGKRSGRRETEPTPEGLRMMETERRYA